MSSSGTHDRRVVVTGVGAVTNLGADEPTTWSGMRDGVVGLSPLEGEVFDRYDEWPIKICGQVKGFDPVAMGACEKRDVKKLDRSTLLALAAAKEAVERSGIELPGADPDRAGVIIGSGVGGIATIEEGKEVLDARGPSRMSPFTVPKLMVNAASGNLSIRYGMQGPATAHATACASSGNAIGDAMDQIRRGRVDVMLAGGAEAAVTPITVGAFMTMRAMSTQEDPALASRPFDQRRDGFVLAEGAAVLVLEELTHAKARGAAILGELVGFGNSSDASHITAPDPDGAGAAKSMQWAMRDAGLNPDQIDYVNAHGTSTPLGDRAEVSAVMRVFGDHARRSSGGPLAMSSTKSVHGHGLGASGAIEMIACLHAVRDGVLAPTVGLEQPDEDFDIELVAGEAQERAGDRSIRYAMNNTFGFGGHNVTLIVARYG